ncbi:hypothetical protein HYS28_02045, partial [Candidatus Uhrbacteria bacterium]|nr:hypothetical protein [Candidatus Uhrbacteria bacterium]
ETRQAEAQPAGIDAGVPIVGWETWEYPPVERSRRWYIIASALGLALLLYALVTANFVFAIIIIMFAVITLMRDLRKPARVPVYITTAGVVFGHDFYPYQDVRDFSIIYNPPEVKTLYVTFHGVLAPTLTVPLEDANPNDVRKALLPYAFENLNREREYLTDLISRLYKL